MNDVPMYWNLVLDLVTFICVDKNHRIPLAMHPYDMVVYNMISGAMNSI